MVTRAAVVDQARGWLGTPFHHGQACRGVGCDCVGLLVGVAAELGLEHDPVQVYPRQPDEPRFRVELARRLDALDAVDAAEGDVLHFNCGGLMHVGIVSGVQPLRMIHAYARHPRRVIESTIDETWSRACRGAWRFRGVA